MIAGVLMVAAAAASWGTWSLFLRPTGLPSNVTSPLMFAAMGLVALPLSWREPKPRWDRTTLALLAGNTVADAANVMTFFAAMRYTTVAVAVLTHYFTPILVALAAPRIDGVSPRGTKPAAVVALAGLVIVLEPWRAPADGVIAGALLGLASAAFYAANVFVVRRLAVRIGTARAVSYHSLLGAAVMLPFAATGLAAVTLGDVEYIAAGGATIGAVSGMLFVAGLARIGAARAAVLTFAEPLVAVVVGAIHWHEPLGPLAIVGGALVLASGVYVSARI